MRKGFRGLFFVLLSISGFSVLSCASTKSTEIDEYYLGNFLPQKLDMFVGNSISEKTGELTPREFESVFYPNGNAVQLSYRTGMNTIMLTLLQKDRMACIDSMKKYIEEYQNGLLTEKNNAKKAYFGSTVMTMEWGLLAPTYKSTKIKLRFEYQIADNGKPYFIVSNASAAETTDEGGVVYGASNSPANRIAFSPLQCQKFIETYNQDNLQSIVDELKAESEKYDLETTQSNDGSVEPNALF
jgi:hypothetical protein